MESCWDCGDGRVIVDPDSGDRVCSSCGRVLSSGDDFQHQAFTSDGAPLGSLLFSVAGAGDARGEAYRERKLRRARSFFSDFCTRLGLSPASAAEALALAVDATAGALGDPDSQWFPVLAAACAYLAMRRRRLPLSLAEAADAAGVVGGTPELARMVSHLARHLNLPPVPEFNTAEALERAVRTAPCFAGVEEEKSEALMGQGRFLLHCAEKWFLTTGRHPLPIVAAVAAFVSEVNGLAVPLEKIANEIYAGVTTSKRRLKELTETLVNVARSLLPWGEDVTAKNLVQNAPLLIRFMELKAKSKAHESSEGFGFCPGDLLIADPNYQGEDSKYFNVEDGEEGGDKGASVDEVSCLKLSVDCLSGAYKKALERLAQVKESGELGKDKGKKRGRVGLELEVLLDSWAGRWDAEKKLTPEQVLNRDVGYDALPPSFVTGKESRRERRAKIEAAKRRIGEIMRPPCGATDSGDKQMVCFSDQRMGRKRRRKDRNEGLDWEDCIIELLLLHRVDEDEIEEGHYNRLLDLHVFDSVSPQG